MQPTEISFLNSKYKRNKEENGGRIKKVEIMIKDPVWKFSKKNEKKKKIRTLSMVINAKLRSRGE